MLHTEHFGKYSHEAWNTQSDILSFTTEGLQKNGELFFICSMYKKQAKEHSDWRAVLNSYVPSSFS